MKSLNQRIQHFYDQSTQLWLNTWGEHMHHGHYGTNGKASKDHQQAQVDMIEALLEVGQVQSATRVLDAGCGVGGSARYLAKRLNARVLGLTLSPVQAERAAQYNREAGLADQVRVEVKDVMSLTAADGPFDLIWSLESAEHMANKAELVQLFYDLLAPGGKLLMATWCHRELPPPLSRKEQSLLQRICKLYHLPPMIAIEAYEQLVVESGFTEVRTEDWTAAVAPFWGAVIRSAFSWPGLSGLLQSSWSTVQGAWAMRYMTAGYRQGIIKYGIVQGTKP